MMALGWRFPEAFLELLLGMLLLELWLGVEGKHVTIPGCGLVMLVTSVSMRVVARMDGLHLIESRVRTVVRIRNST
ncbi:hypothetical protein DEO72_LG7g1042 [Vigna unguiculata]|uniref:Secreted protein n=1 Tax=Vigna unguiculata TaxID=3917 RepID=A0A4D6MID5_VIGUN|nr:hypothetical protein DEO72_LG7g1042 [Vigna unguiculata]